ncbi:CerR family C-terminal domain-containing protein [Rhizobiaceae bacterium BDR2-2]|uniref:CerR family C-terminal domain-containing protein n=1 Tax=Ectorhizobium quercum TaxID=2965071 RepID=A0AAE3N4N5_9HYPH|nr:CerR family C-terminal domain-containing protein [Ectorhizobium quercum]MCX8999871.1 CerR family C-terminal domain-containing protein [Ectorhizobium quercum]
MPNGSGTSGHESRSARTRAQLIEAAIEVIGSVGYEGASTRALAKAANTTLSAIPYHFGGKKELYLAAARMIADYASERCEEVTRILEGVPDEDKAGRFEEALICLLHIILEDAEPHSWTAFVARCTYDNDEAFTLIYDQAIAPLLDRLILAASDFSRRPPDDKALRLRVSAIVTAIASFKFLRGIMLRSMDWETIQENCIRQIEDMVCDLCRTDFLENEPSRDQQVPFGTFK